MENPPKITALASLSDDLTMLSDRSAAYVVSVEGEGTRASGFVWKHGWIVTADEALSEATSFTVGFSDGARLAATLHGRDPSTDVALLKLDQDHGVLSPHDALPVKTGAMTLAIGSDSGNTIAAFGVVTHAGDAWRSMRGGKIDARIDLGLRLDRRAEGGLAFDMRGKAIGMTVFGPRHKAIVIPSATVDRVAAQLAERGRITRGYLGVGLQPVAVAGKTTPCVMVISIDANGPAALAGLHQGDIIVSLDDAALTQARHLNARLGPETVGKVLKVGLLRAGVPLVLAVTIGERPAA